jgi:predicted transcriptional regulator
MLVKFGANAPLLTPSPAANPAIPQQEIAPIPLTSKPDTVLFGRHAGTMMIINAYEERETQIQEALEADVDGVSGSDYLLTLHAGDDLPESWIDNRSKRTIVRDLTRAGLIALNGEEAELTPLGRWVTENIVWNKRREEFERQYGSMLDEILLGREGRFAITEVRGRDILEAAKTRPITVTAHPEFMAPDEGHDGNNFDLGIGNSVDALNEFMQGLVKLNLFTHTQTRPRQNEYRLTGFGRRVIEILGI